MKPASCVDEAFQSKQTTDLGFQRGAQLRVVSGQEIAPSRGFLASASTNGHVSLPWSS
jgi:hypothetical protein